MSDFNGNVQAFVASAQDRIRQGLVAVALAAEARVKALTPVVTGNLRASWVVVIGESNVPQPGQKAPLSAAIYAQPGDKLFLCNPVEYARRIEYGFTGRDSLGRHYETPGRGMLAQTITELPAITKKVFST